MFYAIILGALEVDPVEETVEGEREREQDGRVSVDPLKKGTILIHSVVFYSIRNDAKFPLW